MGSGFQEAKGATADVQPGENEASTGRGARGSEAGRADRQADGRTGRRGKISNLAGIHKGRNTEKSNIRGKPR